MPIPPCRAIFNWIFWRQRDSRPNARWHGYIDGGWVGVEEKQRSKWLILDHRISLNINESDVWRN
jgi:hypothetical protein